MSSYISHFRSPFFIYCVFILSYFLCSLSLSLFLCYLFIAFENCQAPHITIYSQCVRRFCFSQAQLHVCDQHVKLLMYQEQPSIDSLLSGSKIRCVLLLFSPFPFNNPHIPNLILGRFKSRKQCRHCQSYRARHSPRKLLRTHSSLSAKLYRISRRRLFRSQS